MKDDFLLVKVVKIMTPCEIATPGKSRGSWDHRLSLIQQISPDHLAARAITTTRHVRAMDADLDLNFHQPAWPWQSHTTKTSYDRGVTCSYDRGHIRRQKSWRSWLSSVSLSY